METQLILLITGVFALVLGSILGYFARQSIAKRRAGTVEQRLQKKAQEAEEESEKILTVAKDKAKDFVEAAKTEEEKRRQAFLKTEQLLLQREETLNKRNSEFEKKETDLRKKGDELQSSEKELENSQEEITQKLEHVASLSKEDAKKELVAQVEKTMEQDITGRIRKLEEEGQDCSLRYSKDRGFSNARDYHNHSGTPFRRLKRKNYWERREKYSFLGTSSRSGNYCGRNTRSRYYFWV